MPSRVLKSTKNVTFVFPEKINNKNLAIAVCKVAQRQVSPVTAIFYVQPNPSNDKEMVAKLSESGAIRFKSILEEMTQFHRNKMFEMPNYALEFLAKEVIENHNFFVAYNVNYIDKYKSTIDVVGNDANGFISTIKKFEQKYYFDVPQILSLIITDKVKVQMNLRKDLTLMSCGDHTIVYPTGPIAEEFYNEFKKQWEQLKDEHIDLEGLKDADLFKICEEIRKEIRDVYYYIKDSIVSIQGFEESIGIFKGKLMKMATESKSEKKIEENVEEPVKKVLPKMLPKPKKVVTEVVEELDISDTEVSEEVTNDIIFGVEE